MPKSYGRVIAHCCWDKSLLEVVLIVEMSQLITLHNLYVHVLQIVGKSLKEINVMW